MDVNAVIKEIRTMNAVALEDRPKLPEHDFVKFLLPVLIDYRNGGDVNLQRWLEIAGNAHRSIDVVDAKNELLFTVPPILARVPSNGRPLNANTVSVSELAYMYGRKVETEHPAAADAWLASALRNQIIPADQEQVLKYLKEWIKIYKRYNLPLERLIGKDDDLGKLVGGVQEDKDNKDEAAISGEFDDF